MPEDNPETAIYDLAERIVDAVGTSKPDWTTLASWARELAQRCEDQADAE